MKRGNNNNNKHIFTSQSASVSSLQPSSSASSSQRQPSAPAPAAAPTTNSAQFQQGPAHHNLNPRPVTVDTGYQTLRNSIINVSFKIKPKFIQKGPRTKVETFDQADKELLLKALTAKNITYTTFTEPSNKANVFVLRGYFKVDNLADLLAELKSAGIPTTKVSKLGNSEHHPLYLVHLQPNSLSFQDLNQQHQDIDGLKIKWERIEPTSKKLTQCFKCQKYGHSASNCTREYKCVKCISKHEPGKCSRTPKDPESSPQCINCHSKPVREGEPQRNINHAANSRDCPEYKAYKAFVDSKTRPKRAPQLHHQPDPPFQLHHVAWPSYSEAVSQPHPDPKQRTQHLQTVNQQPLQGPIKGRIMQPAPTKSGESKTAPGQSTSQNHPSPHDRANRVPSYSYEALSQKYIALEESNNTLIGKVIDLSNQIVMLKETISNLSRSLHKLQPLSTGSMEIENA